jgi:hypothetical protein
MKLPDEHPRSRSQAGEHFKEKISDHPGLKGGAMAAPDTLERERELLIGCIEDAYEAIRLLPGLDANGPALVWLADHLLDARRQTVKDG